jgi:hypothetical protein
LHHPSLMSVPSRYHNQPLLHPLVEVFMRMHLSARRPAAPDHFPLPVLCPWCHAGAFTGTAAGIEDDFRSVCCKDSK